MSNQHYPVSAVSDRRRRLAITLAPRDSLPRRITRVHSEGARAASGPPIEFPAGGRLDELLELHAELTWVFAGDAPRLPTSVGTEIRFPDGLNHWLRDVLDRRRDILIDASSPVLDLADVGRRFDERIARFAPQIVLLAVPPLNEAGERWNCDQFEAALIEILSRIRSLPALAVVQTPPFFPAADEALRIDQLVQVEAIRGCTAEQGALLVDLWRDGEQRLEENSGLDPAIDPPAPDLTCYLSLFAYETGLHAVTAVPDFHWTNGNPVG